MKTQDKRQSSLTSRTKRFHQISPDWDLWQKLYYKHQQAFRKLSVILDNNTTHKRKMRNLLDAQLSELGIKEDIQVEFIYTPPYSPNFNLAEYLIHQLRLQLLHHQPVGMTIELVREKLEKYLQLNQLQTPQQIHAYNCSYLLLGQLIWK